MVVDKLQWIIYIKLFLIVYLYYSVCDTLLQIDFLHYNNYFDTHVDSYCISCCNIHYASYFSKNLNSYCDSHYSFYFISFCDDYCNAYYNIYFNALIIIVIFIIIVVVIVALYCKNIL